MRIWRKLIRIEKILWWKEGLLALLLVNIINECNLSEDAAFGSCINGAAYQDWPIQRRLLHFPANRDALLEYRYGTARHHKNPAYGRGVSARFVFPAGIKKNPQFFADFTYRALQAAFSGKDRAACTFPVQGECFIRMPLRKKGIVPVCSWARYWLTDGSFRQVF